MPRYKKKAPALSIYRSRKRRSLSQSKVYGKKVCRTSVISTPIRRGSAYSPSPFRKSMSPSPLLTRMTPSPLLIRMTPSPFSKMMSPSPSINRNTVSACANRNVSYGKKLSSSPNSKSKKKLSFESGDQSTLDLSTSSSVNETISLLVKLIENGKFNTNNISFSIFKDTLKWHDQTNVSQMRYSNETKDFFWTGRKLFGGQFIRFMRGFAHTDLVKQRETKIGCYAPEDTKINFAVPSRPILDKHRPLLPVDIPDTLEPGILDQNLEMYSKKMQEKSHVVMFDGKKIVPNSADIFLLDQEDEPKLSHAKKEKDETVRMFDEILQIVLTNLDKGFDYVSNIPKECQHCIIQLCLQGIQKISISIRGLRQSKAKKSVVLERILKQYEKSPDAKYKYAINRIRTFLHEINICLKDLISVVDNVARVASFLQGSRHLFIYQEKYCVLEKQQNYRELKSPNDVRLLLGTDDIPSPLVKQRTDEWFELRKTVKVTGSQAYKALGLDTLAAQKEYFSVAIGGKKPMEPGMAQKRAMEHGTKNEDNAIATLVGKILPVLYPNYIFHEEGCYEISDADGKKLLIVSPDGSLHSPDGPLISVEFKCPLPSYTGATPVYYEVLKRHSLQCLLEASVLKAHEHLYISWNEDSTTVFRLKPNNELVDQAVEKIKQIFYSETPKMPTKVTQDIKDLSKNIESHRLSAEFVGEFPSLSRVTNTTFSPDNHLNTPYLQPLIVPTSSSSVEEISLDELLDTTIKATKYVEESYRLRKPTASEVLVYLISDMDRTWDKEVGHGIPISYLYKGYSLTISTARRLMEQILNACHDNNLHVPCVTFDGQFAKLKDYDIEDRPLTLFGVQRQLWTEVKSMSKKQLLDCLLSIYGDCEYTCEYDTVVGEDGFITIKHLKANVVNKAKDYPKLMTPIWLFKENVQSTDETETENTEGNEIMSLVNENFENICFQQVEEHGNQNIESTGIGTDDRNEEIEPQRPDDIQDETRAENDKPSITLNESDYAVFYKVLCEGKRKQKWMALSVEYVEKLFSDVEQLNKDMTAYEIKDIVKYLNIRLQSVNLKVPSTLRKTELINKIAEVCGLGSNINVPERKKTSKRQVKALKDLCKKVVNSKQYPKHVLAVAYCYSVWPNYEKSFYDNATVTKTVQISDEKQTQKIIFSPLYKPERSISRNQLEVRVMDGTHIRTNIKSKLIRTGLDNIRVTAWKKVAVEDSSILPLAMLDVQEDGKIMHQQSDSFVRTMFSENVESKMISNGDRNAANFCRLIREWHEAEDMTGLSAFERCKRSVAFRQWLLDGYNFQVFPPPTMYVKGIPRVTFEGLLCSIDAHLLLYGMVKGGTYNWRSVSTLVAENFMGELAERSSTSNGVPIGTILNRDMAKISQLHAMRMNPYRSFQMQTSNARVYDKQEVDGDRSLVDLAIDFDDIGSSENNATLETQQFTRISTITLRDHLFDTLVPKPGRHGKIGHLSEHPKGVQPVRFHYKVDESKILPSLRLGLPPEDLNV